MNILRVLVELVAHALFDVCRLRLQLRHPVRHIYHQMEAIKGIEHHHVKWRGGGALFLVAAHVEIAVVGTTISKTMNQPRIAVVSENDRLAGGEQGIEFLAGQTVRVFLLWLQGH